MSTSFEAPYYKKCKKNNAHKQWGRVENPKKYGRKKITQKGSLRRRRGKKESSDAAVD